MRESRAFHLLLIVDGPRTSMRHSQTDGMNFRKANVKSLYMFGRNKECWSVCTASHLGSILAISSLPTLKKNDLNRNF